jgi:hypothetical protein
VLGSSFRVCRGTKCYSTRNRRSYLRTQKQSSKYCFEIDIEHELRLIGQENIISKNAGYPESLKLMWYWRSIADNILEQWREENNEV